MVGTPGSWPDRVAGVHRQLVAGHDPPAGDLRAAHPQHVLVRVEAELVVDADRRDHRAQLARDLACASPPTRPSRPPPGPLVDQRHEAEADRQLERVDRGRAVGRRRRGRRRHAAGPAAPAAARASARSAGSGIAVLDRVGDRGEGAADQQERDLRQPRHQGEGADHRRRHHRRLALGEDLGGDVVAEVPSRRPTRVTMMPVATEISSAGICAARPSPTVSSE